MEKEFIELNDGLINKSKIEAVFFDDFSDVANFSEEFRVVIVCDSGNKAQYKFKSKQEMDNFIFELKQLLTTN